MTRPSKADAMKELQRSQQLSDGTLASSPQYRRVLAECCQAFDALLAREQAGTRKSRGGHRAVHIECRKRKPRKCA